MAQKYLLVPEPIYRGLTSTYTGEPNLDFTKRELDKIKHGRIESSKRNILYNQELRRYLQMRNERESRPARVELTNGLRMLVKKGDEFESEDEEIMIAEDKPKGPPKSPKPHKTIEKEPNNIDESGLELASSQPSSTAPILPSSHSQNPPEIFQEGRDEIPFIPRKWPLLEISNADSQLSKISKKSKTLTKKKNPISLRHRPSIVRKYHSIREELEPSTANMALPSVTNEQLAILDTPPSNEVALLKSKSLEGKKKYRISEYPMGIKRDEAIKSRRKGVISLRSGPSIIRNYHTIRKELEAPSNSLALPEPMEPSALPSSSVQLALEAPLVTPKPQTSMELYGRPGVKYRRDPDLIELVSSAVRRETRKRKPSKTDPLERKKQRIVIEGSIRRRQWARRKPTQEEALNGPIKWAKTRPTQADMYNGANESGDRRLPNISNKARLEALQKRVAQFKNN